jgi:hypothetical protein
MTWLYIASCLIVPALWGAASAYLFTKLDRHRDSRAAKRPPIDYMI